MILNIILGLVIVSLVREIIKLNKRNKLQEELIKTQDTINKNRESQLANQESMIATQRATIDNQKEVIELLREEIGLLLGTEDNAASDDYIVIDDEE